MANNVVMTKDWTVLVTNINATKDGGQMIPWGGRVVILKNDAAANQADVPAWDGGHIFRYAKLSTDVIAKGDALYFDDGNDRLTLVAASGNFYAGRAASAAGNGATTVEVDINVGIPMAAAVADLTGGEAPTEAEFNTLLARLRTTGLIAP